MDDWMSPLNRVTWRNALTKRAAQATLTDGRKFKITYSKKPFGVAGEMIEVAWLFPAGHAFAPCGYLSIEKALDYTWLMEAGQEEGPPGLYVRLLDEFISNDALIGVNVVENFEEMKGRQLQTMRRGFGQAKLARGKKADHVGIVTDDGVLFLVKGRNDDE